MKAISAKCGHVNRQLREGKQLKGELLEFALSVLGEPPERSSRVLHFVDRSKRGENTVTKIGLLIIAAALAGCASTPQERAAEFQQELPELVASCNEWIQVDPRLDGPTIRHDGFKACRRLSANDSLALVDPAIASAYVRSVSQNGASSIQNSGASGTTVVPIPPNQVQ